MSVDGGSLALTPSLLHSVLVDETADNTNDLYIRSVCFSPDGKLLATGAEDKTIRVSSRTLMLTIVIAVIIVFEPSAEHSTTFGALDLGYCQETNPQHIPGSHSGDLFARFLVGREIDRLWVRRSYDEDLGYDGRVVEDPCNHRPARQR